MAEETHYKLIDCDRKDILKLPSGAVHLWFALYMCESEDRESYMSVRTLSKLTGLDTKTVMKWRNYLIDHGWLVKTGATAAQRYSNPTRGANKVPAMRVSDPTKGVGKFPTPAGPDHRPDQLGVGNIPTVGDTPTGVWENVLHPNIPTKVYGYGSVSGYPSIAVRSDYLAIASDSTSDLTEASLPTEEPKHNPTTNSKTKTSGVSASGNSQGNGKAKHLPKYDQALPVDFDDWTVQDRAVWVDEHKLKSPVTEKMPEPVPVPAKVSSAFVPAVVEIPAPTKAEAKPTPRVQPPDSTPPPMAVVMPVKVAKPGADSDHPIVPEPTKALLASGAVCEVCNRSSDACYCRRWYQCSVCEAVVHTFHEYRLHLMMRHRNDLK